MNETAAIGVPMNFEQERWKAHHLRLEHIPSELNRGDSQRSVDERVCRP
jgi:hypothetical protein